MLSRAVIGLVALALCVAARPALSTERQWHVGGGAGVAGFGASEIDLGPALALHAAYGLSDLFDARLTLTASRHSVFYAATESSSTHTFYSADAAFTYKLDVIRWVPYFGVLAGYHGTDAAPLDGVIRQSDLGLGGLAGLDYAFSRHVAAGAQVQALWLLEGTSRYGGLLYAEYRWGY